jgi:hypothetical protein
MGIAKRLLAGILLAGLTMGIGVPVAGADEPCLAVDANGDGVIDSQPASGSGCVVVKLVVEPKKFNIVDLAFPTVHAAVLWTPSFDPASIVDISLCFGDADTPSARACVPLRKRGKFIDLNKDGHPDKIWKWTTSQSGIHSGDTSACLTGSGSGGLKIEGCGPMTTKNG